MDPKRRLGQTDIQQRQPVLNGLQSETAQDQSYAKDPEAPLRQIVGIVFNKWIDHDNDAGHQAGHQSYANGKRPGVIHVANEGAADERGGKIADGPNHCSPELTAGEARAAPGLLNGGGGASPSTGQ